jgi:hypothetical protein
MSIDAHVYTGCAHHRVHLELQLLHRINATVYFLRHIGAGTLNRG